jgi:glutaconate CoA-transferase, subunit B
MSMTYNAMELMICCAARLLEDGRTVAVGTGVPCAAAMLAQRTHAPSLTVVFEAGGVAPQLPTMPISVGDSRTFYRGLMATSMADIMETCQRGMIDYTFLGGAQIDPYGNLNSTLIGGDYARPKVRLPGSGGATEIATGCGEVFIVMKQGPRSFVNELDFLTTLGHGRTGRERRDLGIRTKGPTLLVTDLCVMRPEPETNEMIVTSLHAGITCERVRESTGWRLRFAPSVETTEPPRADELDVLRDLHARTAQAHGVAAGDA